jgi:septum formation protein
MQNALPPLILASASPQRAKILTTLGFTFTALSSGLDETPPDDLECTAISEYLARKKAAALWQGMDKTEQDSSLILGADTTVILGNRVLDKPTSWSQASRHLRDLSGKTHRVITGLALCGGIQGRVLSSTSSTYVTMGEISVQDQADYLETNEWVGAAGGYRIQGTASRFVSRVDGLESTVIGLPIYPLFELLRQWKE